MRTVNVIAVHLNGKAHSWRTDINGTDEEIRDYFVGKWFNVGDDTRDIMVKAVAITFFDRTQLSGQPVHANPVRS